MVLNEKLPQDIADVLAVLYLFSGAVSFLMWYFSGIPTSPNHEIRSSFVNNFQFIIPNPAIFMIIYLLTEKSSSKMNLVLLLQLDNTR